MTLFKKADTKLFVFVGHYYEHKYKYSLRVKKMDFIVSGTEKNLHIVR